MVAVRTGIFAAAARAAAPIYGKYAKLGAPALGDAAPLDFRSGNYGVSFTSGGLLFPYQLGASCVLYDAGILKSDVPVAGASSGGLAAVVGALSEAPGAPPLTDYLDAALRINDFTRGATSGWGKLYPALRAETDRLLDDESAATLNARAAPVTLAVTRLAPLPQPQFVSSFEGREGQRANISFPRRDASPWAHLSDAAADDPRGRGAAAANNQHADDPRGVPANRLEISTQVMTSRRRCTRRRRSLFISAG